MINKCYIIGKVGIRVIGEETVADSEMYKPFIVEDCPEDILITVKKDVLPPLKGKLVSSSDCENVYDTGDEVIYRSFYGADTEFACYTHNSRNIDLTIDKNRALNDTLIFMAVNLPKLLALNGAVICHCSYIVFNDEAILFSAPKQSGKSTQADIWAKNKNALIVNGDRAVLREDNGRVFAYGSPYSGSSHISLNITKPVRAIVFLSKGTENTVNFIESKKERFINLFGNLLCNGNYVESVLDLSAKICENTEMYNMKCRPDKSAADKLEEVLWK